MNKNDILKKIGIIINELQEQYAYAEENADDINDLELELFVANAHFLTDHLEILRKLYNKQVKPLRQDISLQAPDVKPKPVIPPSAPEKRYFEPMVQPILKKEPEPFDFELPVAATPETEPLEEETPEEFIPIEEYTEPEVAVEAAAEEKTLGEEPESTLTEGEAEQELPHMEEEIIIPVIKHQLIYDEPESELPPEEDDVQEGQEEQWIAEQVAQMDHEPDEPKQESQIAEEIEAAETSGDSNEAQLTPEELKPAEPYEITPEIEAESEAETEPIPEPEKKAEPETIEVEDTIEEDELEEKALTLNELLAAQRVADIPQLPPVKDIKSAINLNDKLLYVRDLFNGYSMAYGEAIEILNRFNKFEEADQFLRINYYNKNNWEAKQDTADKFYVLLHRRFPD